MAVGVLIVILLLAINSVVGVKSDSGSDDKLIFSHIVSWKYV